jgi:tRNA pseudouridine38/39 synthase
VQKNTEDTVEHHIFLALKRTCLISSDQNINKSSFSRCGRTDKGVSALGNVCSLYVRELKDKNYCQMLNHCLPYDIRIIAYSEVPEHFDARFSCIHREYKYFFC